MIKHTALTWSIVLLTGLADAAHNLSQTKLVVTSYVNTYFKAPPPSLREMAFSADGVVAGRILGAKPEDRGLRDDPAGRPLTLYRLRVVDVVHAFGGIAIPDELMILREGGERDRGRHIERIEQDGFPQFDVGRKREATE